MLCILRCSGILLCIVYPAMQGSYFDLVKTLKADVVFLSPPWGGPQYNKYAYFDVKEMMMYDGLEIFKMTQKITDNIIYFLPRNVLPEQAAKLAGVGQRRLIRLCGHCNGWWCWSGRDGLGNGPAGASGLFPQFCC